MNRFFPQNGQFWLDDRPVLIQAAEFHYYRTPREQWPHRLGLMQAAGFNGLASYIPWLWHEVEEGSFDFDGHSQPMRDLAGFLDLAAGMGFWLIPRPGPYIMAETINEGIPPWVFSTYPQAAFISQHGAPQNIVSYLHPDFLACVSNWYREVFAVLAPRQITRGGKIIMMQLDNEMGMMHWVRNIIDTNPDTLSRLAMYLQDTYRESLGERYPFEANANLLDFLLEAITHPQEPYGATIVDDYRHFFRGYLREYAAWLWTEAKQNGLQVPPVINIHGFANGGKTFPIGLSQLVDVMEIDGMISATDVYPGVIGEGSFHQLLLVDEMTKALQYPEQALFSIEFQSGGNLDFSNGQSSMHDLHTRLCISSGMRAINNYLFFGGENDPVLSPVKRHDWGHPVRTDGTLRKQYYRYPKLNRVLAAYGEDLVWSQPQTVTTIGFLIDYFMTEVNNEFTRRFTDIMTHQRDVVLFDMIARGLALTHRPFNAVEISRGALDVSKMPTLWVMMERQCDGGTQRKLVDYIRQGGKLILAGRMCVEDFSGRACTLLKDEIGIEEIHEEVPFVVMNIAAFGYKDVPVSFIETYSGRFDEVIATRGNGEVVGFVKTIGAGKVIMFGAAMYTETLGDVDIVHKMALKMDCPSLFELSDWADVRISRGENGSFLFVNNYQDDPVVTTVAYQGKTLFGGSPIRLAARTGLILPLDWQPRHGIRVDYCTSEIVEIAEAGAAVMLKTQQPEFLAELTLTGYQCNGATVNQEAGQSRRIRVHGTAGEILLQSETGV